MMTTSWFIHVKRDLGRRKPGISLLRPGVVGMQGQWSNAYCMRLHEHTHTRCPPPLHSACRPPLFFAVASGAATASLSLWLWLDDVAVSRGGFT
ncbi:unnamed protein product [Ectocarpus sp. 6 AP-2014]